MTTREAVVAEARAWLGTPFHHHGQVKGAGVDCAQILIAVYRDAGLIPDIDVGHYPADWHLHRADERYLGWVRQYAQPTERPLPGDVALFRFGRCISHAGIVVEWPLVIHAYFGLGVVYADAERDVELAGRLAGFWTVFAIDGVEP